MDSELVDGVYNKVCHCLVGTKHPRQVHAFLDRQRLEVGRNFQKDFAEAAMHSTVMVLIFSVESCTAKDVHLRGRLPRGQFAFGVVAGVGAA